MNTNDASHLVPGEGNEGRISQIDSEPIQNMQRRLRFLHYPLSTEKACLGWMRRFLKHLGLRKPEECGEQEIAEFLAETVLEGTVAASS